MLVGPCRATPSNNPLVIVVLLAPAKVAVCMIDFAHAVPVDGDGELGEGPAEAPADKGYLYGASNVSFGSGWCVRYTP